MQVPELQGHHNHGGTEKLSVVDGLAVEANSGCAHDMRVQELQGQKDVLRGEVGSSAVDEMPTRDGNSPPDQACRIRSCSSMRSL